MSDNSSVDEPNQELYFLIAKFLENGPCSSVAEALKEELQTKKILPKRLDWEGEEHEQSFSELETKYPHIRPNTLKEMCLRLGTLLDKEVKSSTGGVKSLLGAGSHSLLRTHKDSIKTRLRHHDFISGIHGAPRIQPSCVRQRNIVQILQGREVSGFMNWKNSFSSRFYSRILVLRRTLGHLSAVYCLLFDRTGKYIITGADDFLVKIWSVRDGRLLCTLRGAASEITDIAVNIENTLLAAGSIDKTIRVWCLQTGFPVAVLMGHTGMITAVNFCPNSANDTRYLVSTSTDGSVAFWSYVKDIDCTAVFQSKPILYNEKMRPGGAQIVCAGFSAGGMFLAAGSADHHVRVYSMEGEPKRIMEEEKHTDRVDSIAWANRSLRFVSGSKDGTALIWRYRAQRWSTTILPMCTVLASEQGKFDESKSAKLRVTIVCWNCDDTYVITATTDHSLKVWDSWGGRLLSVIRGHTDEAFVLEAHPFDPRVFLSAGHDGIVFLWDISTGEQLTMFHNHIEGQGNGALFDAKWSPDGTTVAATDSHGHLIMFSLSPYSDSIKTLPRELFFHTDYRPLVRDSQGQVLDEQTQVPPHLMPPPFLVDFDGTPYPPTYQKLVPGREHCSNEQLIPNVVATNGGDEVIEGVSEQHRLANGPVRNRHAASPRARMRRSGSVEGIRQSSGNWQREDIIWSQPLIVPALKLGELYPIASWINFNGELELSEYQRENVRPIEQLATPTIEQPQWKGKRRQAHSYRTRANLDHLHQAMEEEDNYVSSSHNDDSSDATAKSEDLDSDSSSSDSSSTVYSDWVADHGVTLEPPTRIKRKRKKPPQPAQPKVASTAKKSVPAVASSPAIASTSSSQPSSSSLPQEIPEVFKPSEWLSEVIPKKFPYYPQMGDEVMFFQQGYQYYLDGVREKKVYQLAKSQYCPWGKLILKEPELVKVIGIKYEIRPPRLCCLRLAVMKQNGKLTNDRFTIKYHDVPDVVDFMVLKQTYDIAMARKWKKGDRFRSMIDDGWWWGVVESAKTAGDSTFLGNRVKWDNGEVEYISPWDMEPVDPEREPDNVGSSVPVLPTEIASILYHPSGEEWPGGDRESATERILSGLEEVMTLAIAEPFMVPVDISTYPLYAYTVAYPLDLSTIKARLENRFYRRLTAAQFDVRYLATNAEQFNEPHSEIVKQARIVTDLCLRIIKDESPVDVPVVYRQLVDAYESSNSEGEGEKDDEEEQSRAHRAAASRFFRAIRRGAHKDGGTGDWRVDCKHLLDILWNSKDSEPFREPVDTLEHPDYEKVIDTPMDLSTIREELRGGNYESPQQFCKDIRMMFSNSKNYNTNKRSKIYVMTVRLSAMAEEHIKRLLQSWRYSQLKKKPRGPMTHSPRLRKARRGTIQYDDSSSQSSNSDLDYRDTAPARGKPAKPRGRKRSNNGVEQTNGTMGSSSESDSSESSHQDLSTIPSTSKGIPGRRNPTRSVNNKQEVSQGSSAESSESAIIPARSWCMNKNGVKILRPVRSSMEVSESGSGKGMSQGEEDEKNTSGSEAELVIDETRGVSQSESSTSESETSESSESEEEAEEEEDEDEEVEMRSNPVKTRGRGRKRARSSPSSGSDYDPSARKPPAKTGRPKRTVQRQNYSMKDNSDSEESESDVRPTKVQERRNSVPNTSTRPRRARRKTQYQESSSDEELLPRVSISSRGRIRKLTPHVRALLRD